ncbi:MAG: Gfo/Idh/MocA family oxidoreductase [Victivallales bacterium]|jgi:predicted dehydrogenase|nr:Gfo/Idh/MocA family oxidoreductase [Victivallales bacterium]
MKKVGFGIIGAGMIARFHAQSMASLENVKLIGFFDTSLSAAVKCAEEFNCKAFSTFEEFLADSEIEAVTIATPSGFHHLSVIPAAKAKKHILCEKPLEITTEKCDELIACCRQNKVYLIPVFQTRFYPAIQKVQQAAKQGRFGKMLFASVRMHWYREQSYYDSSSWRGTWAVDGGGALMNQAIHHIDQLLWIAGDATSVSALSATRTHQIEVEDNLAALVQFKSGATGTIEVSTSCKPGFPRRLEFTGDCGSAVIEEDNIVRWVFDQTYPEDEAILSDLRAKNENAAGGSDPRNIKADGHALQIADLAKAIRSGHAPMLDAEEGRRTVEFICGVYNSVRTGKSHIF